MLPLVGLGLLGLGAAGKAISSAMTPSSTGFDAAQIRDTFRQSYRVGSNAVNRRMGVANQDAASTLAASGLGDSGALARFIGLNQQDASSTIAQLLAQLTANQTSALQRNAEFNAQLKANKLAGIGDAFGDVGDIGGLLSILGLR
jgi:hypothetical protein